MFTFMEQIRPVQDKIMDDHYKMSEVECFEMFVPRLAALRLERSEAEHFG